MFDVLWLCYLYFCYLDDGYIVWVSVLYVPEPMNHVCVCVCCVRVYVVYEDTNLYNNMGMTEVLQFEGVL